MGGQNEGKTPDICRYQSFYSSQHQYHYKREAFNLIRGSHEAQERSKPVASDSYYGREMPLHHYLSNF